MADAETRSDEQLVEASQAAGLGDHRAFEELVIRHRGKVLANCRLLTRSDDDAEDLAQEVFVKVFFGLKKFRRQSKFATWVQKIKVNHCLNFIRKKRGKVFVDLDSAAAQASEELAVDSAAGGDLDQTIEKTQIRALLGSMPDSLRIPLVLCDMDGLSYQEAADELGIGLSALKMRVKRGREHLRALIEKRRGRSSASAESEET